jgi:hypothetical protein
MIQAKINHRTSSGSLLIIAPCTVATDLIEGVLNPILGITAFLLSLRQSNHDNNPRA